MTTQADHTDDEWTTLRRAPLVAGPAISRADPGGPIELTKEDGLMGIGAVPVSKREAALPDTIRES